MLRQMKESEGFLVGLWKGEIWEFSMYLVARMVRQGELVMLVRKHQARLVTRALFWHLASLICKLHCFRGKVTMLQLRRWIFLLSSVELHKKFLTILLMQLTVLIGRRKHCMRWVGIEDSTDLARVIQPANVRVLVFQSLSLLVSFVMIKLKLECLRVRKRRENP